ncbi:hypothetical protein [Nocardia salmonicida]|uniref:hypothetical protein n=1 Tax=Nocardia salmonicida TaxID=53431 RepID=UPI0007A44E94|nr:hypothetical protein [Nocardia salmonicida]
MWQDEHSALADLLQRSQGRRDLDALHEAFPQMMPAGYGNGHGFGGRNCSATVKPLSYGYPWTKTFDGYAASRSCGAEKMVDTHYTFYTYPTAEAAAAVVARFRQETKDHGQSSTGTRTDDRREQSADGRYNGSAIISTFSEPARARWVLLFYRGSGVTPFPGHTVETNMPILVADVASFPLG